LLNVRLDTIKSWSAGRNPIPSGAWTELIALAELIDTAAQNWIETLPAIPVRYPADDHEARALGFPCVGAWRAAMAQVIALDDARRITLVPRGSTTTTAAAIDAHQR
jgi:hypothetical protein